MSPKITVLTTVYNGMSYLKEAIDSTLNQTFTDFEFLIIDDASTDDSFNFLSSYSDPRIRLIKNEVNLGQTGALNKGLTIAKGEYIARFDQDDVNLPNRLEGQLDMFNQNPELTILCSWEHTIDSDGKRVRDWKKIIPDYGVYLGEILLGLCPVWHPSVMFKKDSILKIGGYDTSFGPAEDYELWSKIAMARMTGTVVPEFHLLQRVHNQRQSHLQADKQLQATRRAHLKVLQFFSDSMHINCLASFIRLEPDSCNNGYNKKHILEISSALNRLVEQVQNKTNLSEKEFQSMIRILKKRIGSGIFYTSRFSIMPSIFFMPLFYALSPYMIPGMRPLLSNINSKLKRLRYLTRSN